MSNLGHLGIKPKKEHSNNKKKLLGERAGNLLSKVVSSIPDNKLTRGIGTGLKFADMAINRNPGTRLYNQAENLLINKGSQFAKDKLKIDPRIASMGLGMMIPGPAGEVKTVKNLAKIRKGSKILKPVKNAKGFIGDVYEVSKKDIPQIKEQLGVWLNQQLKEKGNVKNINRQDFGTIIIDGEPREISRITNYLTGDGKLPLLPKVVTRKQAAFKRLVATQPPKNELNKLGRQLGLTTDQLNEYYQEAVAGFKGVRDAAARHSKFKGEYHAGHFYPASRGGPTSRRSAGIELGIENVTKGNKLEGSINIYAAQKAGIPTTWAEDMKMWLRDKKGLPGPNYAVDFSNEQRNIIESIPWDANIDEVEAIWKKNNLDRIPNADQMQAVAEEFKPKTTASGLKIGFDRH